jgi:hypothetical protein
METEMEQLQKLRQLLIETFTKLTTGELSKKEARIVAEIALAFETMTKQKQKGNL